MKYTEIAKELGIPIIWSEDDLKCLGQYLPNAKFISKNGAMIIMCNLSDKQAEYVLLHELGHKINGKLLSKLSAPQVHIANEGKANRYMIRNKIAEWLPGFDGEYGQATVSRFLAWAQLDPAKFYYTAEDELKDALNVK